MMLNLQPLTTAVWMTINHNNTFQIYFTYIEYNIAGTSLYIYMRRLLDFIVWYVFADYQQNTCDMNDLLSIVMVLYNNCYTFHRACETISVHNSTLLWIGNRYLPTLLSIKVAIDSISIGTHMHIKIMRILLLLLVVELNFLV